MSQDSHPQPQTLPIITVLTPAFIHGAVEIERGTSGLVPHRLPGWAHAQSGDAQLEMAQTQPSGVRVVFPTAARSLERLVLATKRVYAGMPPRPDGVYDLLHNDSLLRQASVKGGKVLTIIARGKLTLGSLVYMRRAAVCSALQVDRQQAKIVQSHLLRFVILNCGSSRYADAPDQLRAMEDGYVPTDRHQARMVRKRGHRGLGHELVPLVR